jgi:hypothetical protein
MKQVLATLLFAATAFAALQPATVSAATRHDETGMTPVVCVTEGCTTDVPGRPTRR